MKQKRSILVAVVMALALVFMTAGSTAWAKTKGVTVYVDDTPDNNGSISCPATQFTTIQDAINLGINRARKDVTLIICPGSYAPSHGHVFDGYDHLTITGRGSPVITAPNGFSGSLFRIDGSKDVTVEGLVIDGRRWLDYQTPSIAIEMVYSSGTVSSNTIARWNTGTTTPVTYTLGISDYSPDVAQDVTIVNNTLIDTQDIGIAVMEAGAATVKKNRIYFVAILNPAYRYYNSDIAIQAGIALLGAGPGATISGNQVESTETLTTASQKRGILLFSTSGTTVTKNVVKGTGNLISIESFCDNPAIPDANGNRITANKLYDASSSGVRILAKASLHGCGEAHANQNSITSNIIYSSYFNNAFIAGIRLEAESPATIDQTTIRNNQIAGFGNNSISETGSTHTSHTGSVILVVPPPGPFSY